MSQAGSSIDPGQHIWWLASRSFGVVAMVLVSLSVGLGLALSIAAVPIVFAGVHRALPAPSPETARQPA